jgi:hypothetical protein
LSKKKTYTIFTHNYIKNIELPLVLSYDEFKIYKRSNREVYIYNYHFSSVFEIFKPNSKSDAIFTIDENDILLHKMCTNYIYIDKDFLQETFSDQLLFYKLKENEIYNMYNDFTEELKNFIKKKNFFMVSEISKKISIYYNLLKIQQVLKSNLQNKRIYLPFKLDFRGRIYYGFDINPTHSKEFRYCIH